ncbi:MAG: PDZ domain-containing protein [Candidatus Cloacimonadaceae bacterium]|nr:PDZ domain-containing protein [Candidatus Cloacimonadaceae bacterium]MDP3114376.1 PDZ domain-containing protein [Candidatus Cloacimonadaceae bacterium]
MEPNSPAAKSGLRVGFVILSIDSIEVMSPKIFASVLETMKACMEKDKRKTIRLYLIDTNKQPIFMVLRFE